MCFSYADSVTGGWNDLVWHFCQHNETWLIDWHNDTMTQYFHISAWLDSLLMLMMFYIFWWTRPLIMLFYVFNPNRPYYFVTWICKKKLYSSRVGWILSVNMTVVDLLIHTVQVCSEWEENFVIVTLFRTNFLCWNFSVQCLVSQSACSLWLGFTIMCTDMCWVTSEPVVCLPCCAGNLIGL